MFDIHWLQDWLLQNSSQWWVYPLAGLFCLIDGFFPPVPSESIIIGFASLTRSAQTNLPLLALVCFAGACIGDNAAYWIGRLIPLQRIFRSEKGQKRLKVARHMLDGRTAEVIISAKFIPIYRVMINMSTGALRIRYRRFILLDMCANALWVSLGICIGMFAGSLLKGNPILGILLGVVLGVCFGFVIERVMAAINKRRGIVNPSEMESF